MRPSLPSLPSTRRTADELATLLERDRLPSSLPADSELARLVTLARALAPAPVTPAPGFRAALRERLIAEAAARPVPVPAPRSGGAPDGDQPVRQAVRHAVATVTALTLVSGVGAAAASTHAVPGDALYGLKRQVEAVQLALAFGDLAEGRELLDQAGARLGEAERLARAGDATATISAVLQDYSVASQAGADELTRAYRDTGSEEPMRVLDRFVTDSEARLADLLVLLDPSLRARVRAALDALAVLGAQTRAVLPTSASRVAHTGPALTGVGSGDGWAVSRVLDRVGGTTAAPAGSASAGGTTLTTGDQAATGGAAGSAGDSLGATVEGATGTSTGGDSTGSGSLDGGVLTGGTSTGSTTLDPVDPLPPGSVTGAVTEPVTGPVTDPTTSVTEPLPGLSGTTTSGTTTSGTTGLPCLPVPPLTSC